MLVSALLRLLIWSAWLAAVLLPSGVALAAPEDGQLWISTVTMSTLPKPVQNRVCQKPTGEYEMGDFDQLPKDCVKSPLRRNGQQVSFDYACKNQVKATMVVNWIDADHLEAIITVNMPMAKMPPVEISISAQREGSCKLPATAKK